MAEQVDDPLCVDDAYAVQFFGFLPQSLLNGIYNGFWEYLQEAMAALNESILITFKGTVSETELQEVSHKRGKIAIDRLDRKFDKAENYLFKNVFSIPDHLVLPSDRPQVDNPCTEEEMIMLDDDIKHVLDRIVAVKYANAQLQDRLVEMQSLTKQLDSTLHSIEKMHTDVAAQSHEMRQTVNSYQHVTTLLDRCRLDSTSS
ncbi:protein MIS12 homolog [Ruditapes philippinarum]|uniref:protein MIS12 homolog n=1 Tax=Ruditapes philippinarum TaxID=129788 RepID=UPI00295B54FE|nr:protein MIS12 homolog [Ruditapes philippinarum]XP_060589026.1 protein MIS12 homolog [Ruditapes philippinarum]XP_060589033.1 protein MIS12 homolog [Ruditapes philippinarum]